MPRNDSDDVPQPARVSAITWLRLMRLPTVFTALTNVLCGFIVSSSERSLPDILALKQFWMLLLSSAGLYLGGMVLNDVFDAALDARERPERPISSGLISKKSAAVFGSLLMLTGVAAAGLAGIFAETGPVSVCVALILAAAVVLYDSVLKNTAASPFGMAGCRFLNIMLGASCAGSWGNVWSGPQIAIAAALAVYVFGVTWFARNEAGESSRIALGSGLAIAMVGIAVNGWTAVKVMTVQSAATGALIALCLIAANVGLRCIQAIQVNQSKLLQKTVGFMLLNIIFIDATMVFCMTGSGRLASMVVIMVIPATLMKRVIPMS
ncbi:MAG: UbiA family prenyltransferase [Fuerstiella sp.]|nr:UbiA family prenyltransferase [Fuerstiella sp.]